MSNDPILDMTIRHTQTDLQDHHNPAWDPIDWDAVSDEVRFILAYGEMLPGSDAVENAKMAAGMLAVASFLPGQKTPNKTRLIAGMVILQSIEFLGKRP